MTRHFKRKPHVPHIVPAWRTVLSCMAIVAAFAVGIGVSGCSSGQGTSGSYALVEDGKLTVASDLGALGVRIR